jgi:hypothetical protein
VATGPLRIRGIGRKQRNRRTENRELKMTAAANGLDTMWRELVRLCNEQFESRPFKRLLNSKITKLRAQHYSIQMAYYVQNRRDCWGYVQGSAPLTVKQIVWRHEEDELVGRKAQGKVDHITLAIKEGEAFWPR